jgi:hypothetical protein
MKKLKIVTAQVWMVDKFGNKTSKGVKRHKIYRFSNDKGVIINDGREVYRNNAGEWCYESK